MYQDKEEKIRESIVNEISQLDHQLTQVARKVDELSVRLGALSDVVNELKMREIARAQIPNGIAPISNV